MKLKLIFYSLFIIVTLQQTNKPQIVADQSGNRGLGQNNLYKGQRNYWIGQRNIMVGADNAVEGFDNKILGGTNVVKGQVNTISGKGNTISGQQNTVKGQNNLVVGSGNIVTNDIGTGQIDFDFESRLPEWMRSSIKLKNKAQQTKNKWKPSASSKQKQIKPQPLPYVTYAPKPDITQNVLTTKNQAVQQIVKPVQIIRPVQVKVLQPIKFQLPTIACQQIPVFQSKLQTFDYDYPSHQSITYTSKLQQYRPPVIPKAISTNNKNNDLREQIQREVQARLKQAFSKAGIYR